MTQWTRLIRLASNLPNVDVNTGNDFDPDNLHLVTDGFYAGHPNPVYASGAAAGLYAVDDPVGAGPTVTQLTDPSDPANQPGTYDDLPVDWATISGGITHPEAGVYLSPGNNFDGKNRNPDGSVIKGPDGSLLALGSSTNGLAEYTAGGVSDVDDAEVLISASFNGNLNFVEVISDTTPTSAATQAGTKVTDLQTISVGGTPLDVTAVGDTGILGTGPNFVCRDYLGCSVWCQ